MKKLLHWILFICVATVSFFFLMSCSKKSGDFPKIGLSIDTLIVERWRTDCEYFEKSVESHGGQVIIKNAANSVESQISQIKELIDMDVDALVIIPNDCYSLSEVLQKAKSKKIPVISYDRLIKNADISLYISIDSKKTGSLMAEELLKNVSNGEYYCIYGPNSDFNMNLLDLGVRDAISGKSISLPVRYFTDDWNYDLGYRKINELLDNHLIPDAIICGNDAFAEVVIKSLKEHKLSSIPVVSQDADISACRRIVDGSQLATVYKPIHRLAELAGLYACRLAKGENLNTFDFSEYIDNGFSKTPVIWLEPEIVTKENLDKVVLASGFHERDQVYRK